MVWGLATETALQLNSDSRQLGHTLQMTIDKRLPATPRQHPTAPHLHERAGVAAGPYHRQARVLHAERSALQALLLLIALPQVCAAALQRPVGLALHGYVHYSENWRGALRGMAGYISPQRDGDKQAEHTDPPMRERIAVKVRPGGDGWHKKVHL